MGTSEQEKAGTDEQTKNAVMLIAVQSPGLMGLRQGRIHIQGRCLLTSLRLQERY